MSLDPDLHQGAGPRRQREVFVGGVAGRTPAVPVAPDDLAEAARRVMAPAAWAYVAGSAGQERTAAANREAFGRWAFVPRQLAGTAERSLATTVLGRVLPSPLMLAPIGVLEEAHPEADLAVARAAAAEGVPFVFSSQASRPMEACAEAMEAVRAGAPRLFQLYWSTDDDLVRSFVRRAEACGCGAIVLTLDTTLLGWRPRDLDLAALPFLHGKGIAQYTSDPVFLAKLDEPPADPAPDPPLTLATLRSGIRQARRFPDATVGALRSGRARQAVQRFVGTYSRPSLGWEQVDQLREMTDLPVVLKGVLHPDDAREAARRGVDAIVVSNHGGRQVDGAIAALDALPAVCDAAGDDLEVWFDSGIRSGADVALALALGARVALLGRPYVYGLAVAGETGVRETIRNVLAELDLMLGLVGARSLQDLTPARLAPPSGDT